MYLLYAYLYTLLSLPKFLERSSHSKDLVEACALSISLRFGTAKEQKQSYR